MDDFQVLQFHFLMMNRKPIENATLLANSRYRFTADNESQEFFAAILFHVQALTSGSPKFGASRYTA